MFGRFERDKFVLQSLFCLLCFNLEFVKKHIVRVILQVFSSLATVDYVEEGADDILMVCEESKKSIGHPQLTHTLTRYCNTCKCNTDK